VSTAPRIGPAQNPASPDTEPSASTESTDWPRTRARSLARPGMVNPLPTSCQNPKPTSSTPAVVVKAA
jgi:hypothetical protein